MPQKPTRIRVQWVAFPDETAAREIVGSAREEAIKSRYGPPAPYQFTIKVMRRLYAKLLPNVLTDDEVSITDPEDFFAACRAELRAIAYFSWHNQRKLFVTRRVFPHYFGFFSLSYVDEGWGALGELLQSLLQNRIQQGLFTKVPDVCANHRFLPFLKEAHRLDYKAAFVIPFFEGHNGELATIFTKANLKGAMVFYLAERDALPVTTDTTFKERVADFPHKFSELVCLNEQNIQTPVPRTKDAVGTRNPWNYWAEAQMHSQSLVFAELRVGVLAGDKEKVALGVQSALSSGDFVCLRDTISTVCTTDLCFWVTCLVDGKGPDEDSEDVFADKLRRSIAQAVANACATDDKLQLQVNIHARHLSSDSQPT